MFNNQDTCYYKITNIKHAQTIAFDFDNTLVKLRTCILLPNVKDILINLSKKYNIIIFSNQMGITKKKITHNEIQHIFSEFLKSININISIFYSIEDDNYRKPMVGMYLLYKQLSNNIPILYYCGDAGGRKSDFDISDLYFANNCNIQFKYPEELFNNCLDNKPILKYNKYRTIYNKDIFNNGSLSCKSFIDVIHVNNTNININMNSKNLIIMVGPQASGKSTLSNYLSNKYNLEIISNDTNKNSIKLFNNSINNNNNGIIIDNTNPNIEKRKLYYNKIPKDWNITIIYINISKNSSIHLCKYRLFHGGKKISIIPIHLYYKKLEQPSTNEGNIITINKPIIPNNHVFNYNLRF